MKFPLLRLFTLAAALAGAAHLRAADAASVATSAPSAPGRLAAGDAAPDFTVEGPKGEKMSLADFKGKVLIVDVSATWCGPCQAAMPNNDRVFRKYADQGVVLLGVTADDNHAAYTGWVQRNASKYAFTMTFDPAGREHWNDSVFNTRYHVSGFPTMFVIGRDGRIVETVSGGGPGEDYRLEYALARAGVKVDLASLPPEPKRDASAPKSIPAMTKTAAISPPTNHFGTAKYGDKVPDLTVVGVDGREVKLSSFKGKPVLVSFWTGARAPGDDVAKLYATYKDQGLVVWAINVATERADFDAWAKAHAAALGYHIAWDPAGKAFMESAINVNFGVGMFPANLVVGADGDFRGGIIGMGAKTAAWVRYALSRAEIKLTDADAAAVKTVFDELAKSAHPGAMPMMGGGLLAPAAGPRPGFRESYGHVKAGDALPDFTVLTPEGKEAKFSDYAKGKTVVLDFWATWCGPCQKAMPHYQELSRKYADKGVVVLGVCCFDTRENYDKWLKEHAGQYTFATVFDPVGKPAGRDAIAKTVMAQVSGDANSLTPLPTTIVVNPKGQLVGSYAGYGPATHDTLANLLMLAGVDLATEDKPKVFFPKGSSVRPATIVPKGNQAAAPHLTLLKPGTVAPDFVMRDVNDQELKLSSLKGKVVILDFWATWCGPCIASMPHTQKIAAQYKDQDVVVIASGTSDTIPNFKKWIPANQPKYPDLRFVFDPKARGTPDFEQRASSTLYGVSGIPTQFVIGRDGKIVAAIVGNGGENDARTEGALALAGVKMDPARAAEGKKALQRAEEEEAASEERQREAEKNPPPPFFEGVGAIAAGKPVGDFTAEDAAGKPVKFSDLSKGKTTVIVFWSAGQGIDEGGLALYNEFSRRYADQGLLILGVAAYADRAAYDGWRKEQGSKYAFPVVFDPAGGAPRPAKEFSQLTDDEKKAFREVSRGYFGKVIPMSFTGGVMMPVPNAIVVDAHGDAVGIYVGGGPRNREALSNLLLRAGIKLAPEDRPQRVWTHEETKPKAPEAKVDLLKVGAKAPDFTGIDAAGKPVKLSDYKGKVVILDFWATWCGPCIASMPHTQEVAAHYKDQGVVVLASCTSDSRKAFEGWVKRNQEKFPDLNFSHDPAERSPDRVSHKLYGVGGIPQQFVIDRDGTIVALVTGYLKGEVILEAALAKAGIKVDPALVAKGAEDLKKRE
ncbi:MAG: redoxin domain-containing protein [Verrucomicrobia bacterium]|nr:redoxin domain-containing protein [Verrucomicrobiota bacterium]